MFKFVLPVQLALLFFRNLPSLILIRKSDFCSLNFLLLFLPAYHPKLRSLEFSGLHCCLFVKVHLVAALSGNSDIISCVPCFVNNFLIYFSPDKHCLARWNYMLSYRSFPCQQNFSVFYKVLLHHKILYVTMYSSTSGRRHKISSTLSDAAEPIWQSERRKRDLNPRAGCPTYTLSRGASSAS